MAKRKRSPKYNFAAERDITISLLRELNANNHSHELMASVTSLLREWSGCEAVGIRLREGDGFPYFETRGFSSEFVAKENQLCLYDIDGQILRDAEGNAVLECMCGNVLCGRFGPELPFFTEAGSFWTNSTSRLLASSTEADRQSRTRNRCQGEGYESVALVPLRSAGETFGLLQFNDRREDCFCREQIELFERLASSLAIGIAQRRATESLRQSEKRFRSFFQSMLNGVCIHELVRNQANEPIEYRILDVNPRYEEILGLKRADVVGELGARVYGTESAPYLETYAEVVRTGEPVQFEAYFPPMEKHFIISAFSHVEGQFVTVFEDVTDRKLADQRVLEAEQAKAAAEKLGAAGRMAAHIAHEINNPLAGVKNAFRLVKDAVPQDHPDRDMVATIDREIDRISDVVRQIYRLHSDRPRELANTAIADAVRDTLLMLGPLAREHEVQIEVGSLDPKLTVKALSGGVHQVLYNLLSNAIEASPEGGCVQIASRVERDVAEITVRDAGAGIPRHLADKVFDPFVSTKGDDPAVTGLGLGLSIVKGVVEASGGRITFQSNPDRGTTFHVFFPLAN